MRMELRWIQNRNQDIEEKRENEEFIKMKQNYIINKSNLL